MYVIIVLWHSFCSGFSMDLSLCYLGYGQMSSSGSSWNSSRCYCALPLPSLLLTKQFVWALPHPLQAQATELAHSTYSDCLNYLSWFCLKWVREHTSKQLGELGGSNQCPRDHDKQLEKRTAGHTCFKPLQLFANWISTRSLHVSHGNTSLSRWGFFLSHHSENLL